MTAQDSCAADDAQACDSAGIWQQGAHPAILLPTPKWTRSQGPHTYLGWQNVGLCQCPCIEPIAPSLHGNRTGIVLCCCRHPHAPCCLYKAPPHPPPPFHSTSTHRKRRPQMSQQPRAPSATHLRWQDVGLCQCPCIEPIPSRFHSNSTRVVLRCRCYPHAPCCLYQAPTGWHCLTAVQYEHLCGSVKSEHLEKV